MIWLCVSVVIIVVIMYVIVTNDRRRSQPAERGEPVPKAEEGCKDDLDEIELYIDELDENGEPW